MAARGFPRHRPPIRVRDARSSRVVRVSRIRRGGRAALHRDQIRLGIVRPVGRAGRSDDGVVARLHQTRKADGHPRLAVPDRPGPARPDRPRLAWSLVPAVPPGRIPLMPTSRPIDTKDFTPKTIPDKDSPRNNLEHVVVELTEAPPSRLVGGTPCRRHVER